jgi:hypothetical protein|tara:strand:- start:2859 stop:3362 length:504 start_codon:yes stop_codon:yes gene_type:complete
MKIFQNFLSKNKLNIIRSILEDDRFPYYYQDDIAFKNSKNKSNNCDFFFAHALFKEEIPTSGDKIIESVLYPITDKLNCKKIIRAKVNLYTNQHKHVKSEFHVDTDDSNVKVAIFSLGTNNGYTEFKTGEKVLSKDNCLLSFSAKDRHRAVTQTDTKRRINININYI